MAPERRNQVILLVAAAVVGVLTYRGWPHPSEAVAPSSNGRAASETPAGGDAPAGTQAPTVHLPALEAERPKPGEAKRNLFRFKPKPPPPVPTPSVVEAPKAASGVPQGPPPPPAIPLKFIGFVADPSGQSPKIAVLSDSVGHVFQGTEGNIIEGRYRILRIGAESIEMAYVDGTGRRTIRLTGG